MAMASIARTPEMNQAKRLGDVGMVGLLNLAQRALELHRYPFMLATAPHPMHEMADINLYSRDAQRVPQAIATDRLLLQFKTRASSGQSGTPRRLVRTLISLGLAIVSAGADAGAEQFKPTRLTVVSLEPHALFKNKTLAGCGFRAAAKADGSSVLADLTAYRDGSETVFALSARWQSDDRRSRSISAIRLTNSAYTTDKDFSAVVALPEGLGETRAKLPGFAGASFIQQNMVEGGDVTITDDGGKTVQFALPRPMPHNVRTTYMTCAGDLFRPESP